MRTPAWTMTGLIAFWASGCVAADPRPAAAPAPAPPSPNGVAAGALAVEPATFVSLGFEWSIAGDRNRNARAAIAYRKQGERNWKNGLDLVRLRNERTLYGRVVDFTAPNMFAGSLFDLEPGATYEVRLTLTDPDGAAGAAERTLTATTRTEPEPFAGGRVLHVYPPGYDGPKEEPAFSGLKAAYDVDGTGADWSRVSPPRVQPGDTIMVHAGLYQSDYRHYSGQFTPTGAPCCGTPFDGTYYLTADGEPGKPISIVAAGDGEVIFDGGGNTVLFNVMAADYTLFRGLTFRNTGTVFEAGQKGVAGSEGLTLQHNRFENVGVVAHSDWAGSKNFTITDNVMIGRNDPDQMHSWMGQPWTAMEDFEEFSTIDSYYAVSIYGPGHVMAYNYVSGFHDGLDHATFGMPVGYPDIDPDTAPVSIDIYNNDITNMHDNCIEADGAMRNVRVFRNRCFNAALGGLSAQPVFGGPVYFFDNVVYNNPWGTLKIHADPSGVLVYNNTLIGEVSQLSPASNIHFRNNLILGQGARDEVFAVSTRTAYSSSDYNGFRPNPEPGADFSWDAPPAGEETLYGEPVPDSVYDTFADYVAATGQDRHSVLLDYDSFVRAAPPDLSDPTRLYVPGDVDLTLRPDSPAVDAGTVLPGITDGYAGAAPDLGAYELGRPLPHYGPRPAD